jgi:peptide/nickel transport system substrate-binding protein
MLRRLLSAFCLLLSGCAQPTGTPLPITATMATPTAPPTAAPAPPPTPLPSPTPGPVAFAIGLPVEADTLDPAEAGTESALLITRHMYEGLTQFAPGTARPVPALAESWQVSDNGLQWRFALRRNAVFSDGTPFTAQTAARNFNRWLTRTPSGSYAFFRVMFGGFAGQTDETGASLSNLRAVTATTSSTLILTLNRPDASLPATLAMPSFAMVNPLAWTSPDFGSPLSASAGTGPFRLRRWAGDLIELERNPVYRGARAAAEALLFKIIPDDVQRLNALKVGEVDGMAGLNPSDYDELANWPIRLEFDPPLQVLYLGFNQAKPPWGNAECRRAVALALDRERYVTEFFPGDAEVANTLIPGAVLTQTLAPDVAGAADLWQSCLRAEGIVPGAASRLAINLYVPPIPRFYLPDPAGLGAALQADLASAGITVTVQSPDWETVWLPEVQAGRADLFLLGWYAANGDPDGYLCPLFCGGNAAFNTDKKGLPLPPDEPLAQLLLAARATTDEVKRAALYAQAHARIFETMPAIPLAFRKTAWAYRNTLTGTIPSPIENVFFGLRDAGR